MNRCEDLIRFYALLERLEQQAGSKRTLVDCSGRMNWPERGVYFFFEDGEVRSDTGSGLRVVRVGSSAVLPLEKRQSLVAFLRRRVSQFDELSKLTCRSIELRERQVALITSAALR